MARASCCALGGGLSDGDGSPSMGTSKRGTTFRMSRSQGRLPTGIIRTRSSRREVLPVFWRIVWNMLCRSVFWADGSRAGMCGGNWQAL